MPQIRTTLRAALILPTALAASLWMGCGDDQSASISGGAADNLLAYAPRGTPYVVASGKPLPDAYEQRAERVSAYMTEMFESELMNTLEREGAPPEARAIAQEVAGYFEQLVPISMEMGQDFIVYGDGLTPVLRWRPETSENLLSLLDQLVAEPDVPLTAKTAGDTRYWELVIDPFVGVLTQQGDVFSASYALDPDAGSALLARLTAGPEGSAPELTDKLDAIRAAHDLGPEAVGFVDTASLVAASDGIATLSAECRTEIDQYVALVPRLVGGYRDVQDDSVTFGGILELAPDAAKQLGGWSAPMPAAAEGGLFSFAFSLELQKAVTSLITWEKSLANTSAKCGVPMEGNSMSASAAGVLLGLGMAGTPKGLRLTIDGYTPGSATPLEALALTGVVSADDPKAAVAMAATQQLPVRALLESPGTPVELSLPGLLPPGVWAVVTNNALGISTGADAQQRLMQAVTGPPAPAGTFLAMSADYARISELLEPELAEGGSLRQRIIDSALENAGPNATTPEQAAAELDQFLNTLKLYKEMLGRVSMSIRATDRGIEFIESATFK